MRTLLGLLLVSLPLFSQTLTLTADAPISPGASGNLTLTLAGSAPAAIYWAFQVPSSIIGWAVSPGPGMAGKQLVCGALLSGVMPCIIVGGPGVLSPGVLVKVVAMVAPGRLTDVTVPMAGVLGAALDATAISPPITFGPAAVIPVNAVKVPKCDVTGDFLVNASDLLIVENQALQSLRDAASGVPLSGCTSGDVDGDGKCTVLDVQKVQIAVNGGPCL